MRVVVTGAGGFIGWHLTDALAKRGDNLQAWVRDSRANNEEGAVEVVPVDVRNPAAVERHLAGFAPDLVVHLAAQSSPELSWKDPALTYQINVLGTVNLLEAARALANRPRLLLVGSSAEYAERADARPIVEDDPVGPNSPYGASKHAADVLAQLYVHRYGLDAIRVRPFYLTGPRKTGDVSSDFARRIIAIERGEENIMRVGSLDVVRDLLDIRDGVSGLIRVAEGGKGGEVYNLCSGVPLKIGEILESYRRLARVQLKIVEDQSLMRPLEQKVKVGNPDKLQRLGWKREHNLRDTLSSILDYIRLSTPA